MGVVGDLIVIGILILLNAVFVAAEIALVTVRPTRVEQMLEERREHVVGARKAFRHSTRRDPAGLGHDAGHLDGGVVHVLRAGTVALSPDAVVAAIHAVVAHEDHERGLGEPLPL